MVATFGPWMGLQPDGLGRLDLGDLTVIGLDPNRPTWLGASGRVPEAQLGALADTLADRSMAVARWCWRSTTRWWIAAERCTTDLPTACATRLRWST